MAALSSLSVQPSNDNQPPVFSFRYLQKNSGYSIDDCDHRQRKALLETMYKLSQLTWKELAQLNRHKLGFERISQDDFPRKVKGVPITQDVRYIVFRYDGMLPMVGYRDEAVYYLLWLDNDFKLYDHG